MQQSLNARQHELIGDYIESLCDDSLCDLLRRVRHDAAFLEGLTVRWNDIELFIRRSKLAMAENDICRILGIAKRRSVGRPRNKRREDKYAIPVD